MFYPGQDPNQYYPPPPGYASFPAQNSGESFIPNYAPAELSGSHQGGALYPPPQGPYDAPSCPSPSIGYTQPSQSPGVWHGAQLTPQQLKEMRDAFELYDKNGDGTITLEELAGVLYKLGLTPSIPELRALIREADVDGDGHINFDEFCQMMLKRNSQPPQYSQAVLRKLFNRFDKDKSGQISKQELKEGLERLGENTSEAALAEMLKSCDFSGDGMIDFDEFSYMILHPPTAGAAGAWNKLKHIMVFASMWKPRPTDPDAIAMARWEAQQRGKVLKDITFIRHGQSQSNEAYEIYKRDTFIWEPTLTEKGCTQAEGQRTTLTQQGANFQLIVVSPLKRAIQTCLIVCDPWIKQGVPVIVHPLATEQVTGSDDLGDSPVVLRNSNPQLHWDLFGSNEVWWYSGPPVSGEEMTVEYQRKKYQANPWEEPWELVVKRAAGLERWLAERPEMAIAVVAHGDLLEAMTGQSLNNAQSFLMEVEAKTVGAAAAMSHGLSSIGIPGFPSYLGSYGAQPSYSGPWASQGQFPIIPGFESIRQ